MILDSLENVGLYKSIHPRFKQAFEFLENNDLSALPLGKIELDGASLYVNVAEVTGKTAIVAKMETHNLYIDIQAPISAPETMGWIAANKLTQPTEQYNPEKDIAFFADKATSFINVQCGEFAVFFPEDGHQPCIGEGQIKKVVIKVLV